MTRYEISSTAQVTIRERWLVEADSPESARRALNNGGPGVEFLDERSMEDEHHRHIEWIRPAGPALELRATIS